MGVSGFGVPHIVNYWNNHPMLYIVIFVISNLCTLCIIKTYHFYTSNPIYKPLFVFWNRGYKPFIYGIPIFVFWKRDYKPFQCISIQIYKPIFVFWNRGYKPFVYGIPIFVFWKRGHKPFPLRYIHYGIQTHFCILQSWLPAITFVYVILKWTVYGNIIFVFWNHLMIWYFESFHDMIFQIVKLSKSCIWYGEIIKFL